MASRKKNPNPNPNPSLHEDLINEILTRLPVKTLLRFRSVCKSWLSLISSSRFIKTHLSKSTNDPHYTHHGLILCGGVRTCSLYSLFNNESDDEAFSTTAWRIDVRELKMISEFNPDDRGHMLIRGVVGYCNGLVCLTAIDRGVYLWNPATRNIRKLPTLEPSYDILYKYTYDYCYGFWYDELNDAFKVYAVYLDSYQYKMSVYSSKSDCWRKIGDFPLGDDDLYVTLSYQVIFANGGLHWVVKRCLESSLDEVLCILSLDINTEMCREISQPKYKEGEGEYTWTLGTLGKSLSLFCKFDNHADLWVLKKSGAEEFWAKLFTIPYMDRLNNYKRFLKPICISVDGVILLQLHSNIVLYNSKKNSFKYMMEMNFRINENYFGTDVYTYVESLVSPQL